MRPQPVFIALVITANGLGLGCTQATTPNSTSSSQATPATTTPYYNPNSANINQNTDNNTTDIINANRTAIDSLISNLRSSYQEVADRICECYDDSNAGSFYDSTFLSQSDCERKVPLSSNQERCLEQLAERSTRLDTTANCFQRAAENWASCVGRYGYCSQSIKSCNSTARSARSSCGSSDDLGTCLGSSSSIF